VPVYYACLNTGRPPPERLQPVVPEGTPLNPIGFTSAYVDASHRPLFPFGFGLTYTTFAYANLTLSADRIGMADTLRVECDVTNAGKRDGVEVVQLYLRDETASLVRPVRELKDFMRVRLAPGETRRVSFKLRNHELSFLDAAGREIVEPGHFQVWVGGSSQACLGATFVLEGEISRTAD
jgi:beta-glucosidase